MEPSPGGVNDGNGRSSKVVDFVDFGLILTGNSMLEVLLQHSLLHNRHSTR